MLRPKSRMALVSGWWVRGLCSCSTVTAVMRMVCYADKSKRAMALSMGWFVAS
jgi:hypothetical protein